MKNNRKSEKKGFFKIIYTVITNILLSPLYLLKGVFNIGKKIVDSFSSSIRMKITLNYIILYSAITLTISIIILGGTMVTYIVHENNSVVNRIDAIVEDYYNGEINIENVNIRIKSLGMANNCVINFDLDGTEISSENYEEIFNEENFFNRVKNYYTDRMYPGVHSDKYGHIINIARPIRQYGYLVTAQASLLLSCFIIGNIFIWIFGNINNKRILKPLFTITDTAEKISISNLSERLDVKSTKYELKDLAITLNEMLDRLDSDYEKQKRFVSDVSHELRTPISIITGYTNMLKRWGKDDEEVLNESIDAIISEADNMQSLVENLLTLVRSDNQTLKFDKERFYIDEMVEEIVRETQMINKKKHHIKTGIHDSQLVYMDPHKVKQAIRIFVDNAVKYTDEYGKIEVNCIKETGQVRIQIIDSGIGMTPQDIERIFDRFYRSDISRTRETGGHGLGLSIAKVIVIGHNGIIKVKSKLGEGSEFNIIFPLESN